MSAIEADDLPADEEWDLAPEAAEVLELERPFNPWMTLALHVLDAALPKQLVDAVRCGMAVVAVIETPADVWVSPMVLALNQMFEAGAELVRPQTASKTVQDHDIRVVSRPLVAVAADPAQLPQELIAGADYRIRLTLTPGAVEKTLKTVYGRSAKVKRSDFAGLGWRELMMSFRPGSGPRVCLNRMRTSANKLRATSGRERTPSLWELASVGDVIPKLLELASDIKKVRDGALDAPLPSVLLVGEPGVGKTTIARALAQTVGLPIVETSVGDWFSGQQSHLGTVIAAARQFFERAAACAPCVAFIDEIDGLPNRAALGDKDRNWWTPVVTTVLVAIDRMRARDSRIVLVCATNHVRHLDAALVRPGRLDLHLEVRAPTSTDDHLRILAFYLKGDLQGTDLTVIARAALAVKATPATIRSWVLRAREAARSHGRPLELGDLAAQALPASNDSPQVELRVALHEAAHVVAARQLGIDVSSVSMIENGHSLGRATFSYGDAHLTREQLERHVVAGLAGRACDELFNGGAAANAKADLAIATHLLASIHLSFGLAGRLSSVGGLDEPESLLASNPDIRLRIEDDLARLMEQARTLVAGHESKIRSLAAKLIAARVLDRADIDALIAESADPAAVDARPTALDASPA